ncbi:MAG: hypothetical protein ACR2IQ_00550 [Minisyncoccia bacterium]
MKNQFKEKQNQEKQNKINVQYITKIINGNYEKIPKSEQVLYINAFSKWQEKCNKLFSDASSLQKKTVSKNLKKWYHVDYKGICSSKQPDQSYKIVLENCFTEPFPSTHDMDDFFLDRLTSELTVLGVIDPKRSENYYVHVKKHFVNHDMVRAIMTVDIYCEI